MNPFTGCKVKTMLGAISANGAYTTTGVDCSGFGFALVIVQAGLIGAGDFTVFKLQQADADTGYADFSVNFIRQTTTVNTDVSASSLGWTVPGDTNDGACYTAVIDLKKCKKWLKLAATSGAASLLNANIVLICGDQAPNTATEMGVQENLIY